MLARIQKSMKEKEQGFTLIELLVVMIIIGILAAIAIPVFLDQKKKAADTAIKSDLTNAAQQVETAYVDAQQYPDNPTGTTATNFGSVTAVASSVKVSKGNTIGYFKLTDGSGFCLQGSSASSDATGAGTVPAGAKAGTKPSGGTGYYWYVSTEGGLQAKPATAKPTACV